MSFNAFSVLTSNLELGRGSSPYLIGDGRSWIYEEVVGSSASFGAALRERGVPRGGRVIVALRDRYEFVVSFWGCIHSGLVPVPVAQGLSPSEAHFILSDSEAAAVVVDLTSARSFVPAAEQLGVTSIGLDGVSAAVEFGEVTSPGGGGRAEATDERDIALWLYTSGTTGLPKAAMHTHRAMGAAGEPLARSVLGLGPQDRVLSTSKMFFAYGLGNSIHLPAAVGASVVLNEGPVVPARIASLITAHRPTILCGVPSFFSGFVRLSGVRMPSEVRAVLSAGEALSAGLFELFHETFGLPLLDGLGATEALHHVTCNRPGDTVPGSAGPPLPGYEVKVLDARGEQLPEGEPGELWVRGPTIFDGYWKRPELTAQVLQDGWLRTGDRVRLRAGRVFHEGRLDDLIKLGGIWVAPTEIEEVLKDHPDVSDAAVVAVDNLDGVPTVKAYVVSAREDVTLIDELNRLSRGRLSRAKAPAVIERVGSLPRTVSGKLQRFVLREHERQAP